MAEMTTQAQIIREAPEIEAYKLGLLSSAKTLAGTRLNLPAYNVAGMSADQISALRDARAGVGAYRPYLTGAETALTQAGGLYAGLPGYGTSAVTALTGAGAYALQQAGTGISRAAAASDEALRYGAGAYTDIKGAAGQATGIASGAQQAALAGAQAYDPYSVYEYMNPYQQAATQATLAEIARQGNIAQTGIAAQAVRAGAFGGSREGIQRAELQRNVLEQQARTAAQDYSVNFQQAQQASLNAFQNQQARMQQAGNVALGAGQLNLQAGQSLAQTGLNAAQLAQQGGQLTGQLGMQAGQLGLSAGQALGQANVSAGQLQQAGAAGIAGIGQARMGLGQATSALGQADTSFLYNMGAQQQAQTQRELDAARSTSMMNVYEPFQRTAFLSDIYKGAPSSQMAFSQASAPSPSPFSQAAGLGIAGLSAYNLMGK